MDQSTDEQIAAIVAEVGMSLVNLMTQADAGIENSLTLDAFGEQWIVSVKRVVHPDTPREGASSGCTHE